MFVFALHISKTFNYKALVLKQSKSTLSSMPEHLSQGSSEPPLIPGKLRLYGMRFCPYDHRAHLVLLAKDIPHDNVFINLTTKPDWYMKRVPSTKVPGLIVDGEALYESLIIADFLDERFPQRQLQHSDPLLKAKDRILIENFGKVTGAFFKVVKSKEDTLAEEFDGLVKELEVFEKELSNRATDYFCGKKPGMVDYMIWPWFERLGALKVLYGNQFDVPAERLNSLVRWMKSMMEDKAVKAYCINDEAHAKFMKSFASGTPDFDIPV